MAFEVEDRVRVTDQSTHYRNQHGTVMRVDGGHNYVRLDGQPITGEVRLRDEQLASSGLASPIDYPE